MLSEWIGHNVAVHNMDGSTVIGKLIDATPQGITIEYHREEHSKAPFDGLTTETEVMIYIPHIRIKALTRAISHGIR